MRICVIGKYPPIEGGVSAQIYWTCHMLARAGHNVFVVTNADEVELEHREWFLPSDAERLDADYPGGGSVRVSFTQAHHDDDLYYIPYGRPTITRLASVAVEVVRQHHCDLLIGWYMEPYVVATSLVAFWTQRPYLVRHAGSDAFELAAQPELGPAYREAVRASAGVVEWMLPAEGLGLPTDRVFGFPGLFLSAEFGPTGPVLDLVGTAQLFRQRGSTSVLRTEPLPPGTALIGTYGKLGVAKGTIDLIWAVSRARAGGHHVGLALAGGGRGWSKVVDEVRAAGLAAVTLTLPMLAPWRIPSFIRACHAVAFLERDFGVVQHRPTPPVEVLACGRPLLLSSEVALKVLPSRWADSPLLDSVEIADPHDADALSTAVVSVLSRPAPAAEHVRASVREEADVARWYARVFEQVSASARRPALDIRMSELPTAPAVEALLARHCPALVHMSGMQVVQRHLSDVETAPNALTATYAVADAVLPELQDAISSSDDPAHAVAQLALAEHHALWSHVDVESLAGVAAFSAPVRRVPVLPTEPEQLDTLFPVASSWLRIAQFDVDAFAHLQAVASGRSVTDSKGQLRERQQVLLFHKAPNLTRTISRIGAGTRALLEAADGTQSLRRHAEALGFAGEHLTRFLGTVRELHNAGVLSFRRELLRG
jgi:glycosyltransferase involved in cell wall biosynthesis